MLRPYLSTGVSHIEASARTSLCFQVELRRMFTRQRTASSSPSACSAVSVAACQSGPRARPPRTSRPRRRGRANCARGTCHPDASPRHPSRPPPRSARRRPCRPPSPRTSFNPLDTPHTYIQDTCQYLHDKWDPNNAAPGTIVIAIMFHGINKNPADVDANGISDGGFREVDEEPRRSSGSRPINTTQLADFLEHNAKIPTRSVYLIQDDRHHGREFQ